MSAGFCDLIESKYSESYATNPSFQGMLDIALGYATHGQTYSQLMRQPADASDLTKTFIHGVKRESMYQRRSEKAYSDRQRNKYGQPIQHSDRNQPIVNHAIKQSESSGVKQEVKLREEVLKDAQKPLGDTVSSFTCYICKEIGHKAYHCPSKPPKTARALLCLTKDKVIGGEHWDIDIEEVNRLINEGAEVIEYTANNYSGLECREATSDFIAEELKILGDAETTQPEEFVARVLYCGSNGLPATIICKPGETKQVIVVVDTGSTISFISGRVVRELLSLGVKLIFRRIRCVVKTADNRDVLCQLETDITIKLNLAALGMRDRVINLSVVVMQDAPEGLDAERVDIIMGMDDLAQWDMAKPVSQMIRNAKKSVNEERAAEALLAMNNDKEEEAAVVVKPGARALFAAAVCIRENTIWQNGGELSAKQC